MNESFSSMIGLVINGNYKIIYHLGGGAYGQTYLAETKGDVCGEKFVIKQFKPIENPFYSTDKNDGLTRFRQEASTLKILGEHSCIPSFVDFIEEDNQFYLIQEFIDGMELEDELTEVGTLDESDVFNFLVELLETLSFVHQKNIIHRDIKPSNIIRRHIDRKPVLIDFGAIKEVQKAVAKTRRRTVAIGTEAYMPNEQANGNPRLCSDVYSLGLIAVRALIGFIPEEDYDTGEFSWRHYAGNMTSEFAECLDKMIRCHFSERYFSALEALNSLREISAKMGAAKHNKNKLCFGKAIEEIWFERANSLRAKKLHSEAISLYFMSTKAKPSFYRAWFNIGITMNYLKRHQESKTYFQEAINIRNNFYSAWLHKGISFFREGSFSEAITCLENAHELDDQPWLAALYKSISHYEVEQEQEAKLNFEYATGLRKSLEYCSPRICIKEEFGLLERLREMT